MLKNLLGEVAFVILSPEPNFGRLKSTLTSVRSNYPCVPVCCVVPEMTTASDMDELATVCPVFRAGQTVTSLINKGMDVSPKPWTIFLMEGSQVIVGLVRKYSLFARDENSVLFPVVVGHDKFGKPVNIYSEFHTGSLNGLMIHRNLFKRTGKFTDNPLEVSKFFWELEAVEQGCQFMAVLGVKVM